VLRTLYIWRLTTKQLTKPHGLTPCSWQHNSSYLQGCMTDCHNSRNVPVSTPTVLQMLPVLHTTIGFQTESTQLVTAHSPAGSNHTESSPPLGAHQTICDIRRRQAEAESNHCRQHAVYAHKSLCWACMLKAQCCPKTQNTSAHNPTTAATTSESCSCWACAHARRSYRQAGVCHSTALANLSCTCLHIPHERLLTYTLRTTPGTQNGNWCRLPVDITPHHTQ
jgi:hypothetical protein